MKKLRIKQYYTSTWQTYTDFVTGYRRYFKELLQKFASDYSLTITEWEPSTHPYYSAEKCFLTFAGKNNLFEYYLYYQTNTITGAEFGIHTPGSESEYPDGLTQTAGSNAISSAWSWNANMKFYFDLLEIIDVEEGQEEPEIGELVAFGIPHYYLGSSSKPLPDDISNVGFAFDLTKNLVVCLSGAYPTGDLFSGSLPSFNYWIQNFDNFDFAGTLVDGRKSWNNNARCIVGKPLIRDLWGNYSALDFEGVYALSNRRFNQGDTVHADKDYILVNEFFDAVAYDSFVRVLANPQEEG